MGTVNGILGLFCAACTLVLVFSLQRQQAIQHTKESGIFHWMLVTSFIMLLLEGVSWFFFGTHPAVFRVLATLTMLSLIVLLGLYSDYVEIQLKLNSLFSRRIRQINYALCGFLTVLWVANGIRPFFYEYETLRLIPSFGTVLVVLSVGVVFLDNVFLICVSRDKIGQEQFIIMMFLPLMPVVGFIPSIFGSSLRLLFPMTFFTMLANYVRLFNLQYASLDSQREKLHSLQIRSTTERMKPHYIYNVLTSIYYLCETDPPLAQKAVGTFSDYLRSVLENLDAGGLIPFEQEMQTIRSYLSLEQLRFGDRFSVEFDITTDQFLLPPFSVQPLVENAVKHGVGQTNRPGEIIVESYETPTHYIVAVRDNCGGFDVEHFQHTKSNFGLRYIQKILDLTVNGKMKIESEVGAGTTVTIQIPKE